MISYPTNFPLPTTSLDGQTETPVVRTDLDTGLVEQEGRFSTGRRTFSASWKLNADDLLVFENWVADDLAGGCLIFGMTLHKDGGLETVPVRFVGGEYSVTHDGGFWFTVSADIENMLIGEAPTNRTLPVPLWKRLAIDPMTSQVLTLSHRNAQLVVHPADGDTTTLRVFPPTSSSAYIYFGIKNEGAGEVLITSADVDPLPPEAVISFPGDLPNVNRAFSFQASRKASRVDMESGHPRQWAGFDTTTKVCNVQWELSLEQLGAFQDFFFTTLQSGTKPFFLKLPTDGTFDPVYARFVGGSYKESYVPVNRFVVTARVERYTEQTVTPDTERPYPVFYSPTVNVSANRKISSTDAMKFFVVNPAAGQTISLHIYTLEIEFGLLVKGLGNVLITRGPFVVGLSHGDTGTGECLKPSFELRNSVLDLGSFSDNGTAESLKPSFDLVNTTKVVTVPGDTGTGEYLKPPVELLAVLEDIGTINDTGTGKYLKPSFILDT